MAFLRAVPIAFLAAGLAACPGEPEPEAEPLGIAGTWEVSGTTVELEGGDRRRIAGSLIVAQEGAEWTATFDLDTRFQGPHEPVDAEVIGSGRGRIEGRRLEGEAETQIVMGAIPGVDPGFVMAPHHVSTRIVSDARGEVEPDGTLALEIQSRPAPGEEYAPTRTTLRGTRRDEPGGDRPGATP